MFSKLKSFPELWSLDCTSCFLPQHVSGLSEILPNLRSLSLSYQQVPVKDLLLHYHTLFLNFRHLHDLCFWLSAAATPSPSVSEAQQKAELAKEENETSASLVSAWRQTCPSLANIELHVHKWRWCCSNAAMGSTRRRSLVILSAAAATSQSSSERTEWTEHLRCGSLGRDSLNSCYCRLQSSSNPSPLLFLLFFFLVVYTVSLPSLWPTFLWLINYLSHRLPSSSSLRSLPSTFVQDLFLCFFFPPTIVVNFFIDLLFSLLPSSSFPCFRCYLSQLRDHDVLLLCRR